MPTLEAAPVPLAAEVAPERNPVDDSPTASQKRIDAVFTLGAQQAGQQRDAALYAALLQLSAADFLAAAADFPALLARMKKNGQGTGRNLEIFIEAWMDRWLTVDAPGALHFLGGAPLLGQLPAKGNNWDQWRSAQGAAIRILARREPRWTHEFVAALPPAQRDSAAFALLDEVARRDPAQARRFLASFTDGANRLAAVEGFVTGLATADVRAGFDAAMAGPVSKPAARPAYLLSAPAAGASGTGGPKLRAAASAPPPTAGCVGSAMAHWKGARCEISIKGNRDVALERRGA